MWSNLPAALPGNPPAAFPDRPLSGWPGRTMWTTTTPTPAPPSAPTSKPTPIPSLAPVPALTAQHPPYIPSKHLSTGSFLTPQQLVSEYEEFANSLKYASTAPELVFERLVASLKDKFNAAVSAEVERQKDAWGRDGTQKEEKKKEERKKKEKKKKEEEKTKNAQGIIEDSPAISTVVKYDPSSAAKATKRDHEYLVVGNYTQVLKGVPGADAGYGKLFLFDSIKLPLKLRDSTLYDICLPITFTRLNFTTPVQRPSFSSADNYINVPAQTSYSTLLSVCFNWLEISSNEPDLQHGRVDTGCRNSYVQNEFGYTKEVYVHFARPYDAIPVVTVWFSDFNVNGSSDERFETKVYATNITRTGFTICLLKPRPEDFLVPIITWLAYSATRKDILRGRFSTTAERPRTRKSHARIPESEKFNGYGFTSPPRIFIGFDSLDVDAPKGSVEVETRVYNVTAQGMSWTIFSSEPTVLNSASVTYLAFV
ncbi:hypothetical protein DFP73DRAFT_564312 [Morchella snyderi]|nr:hypothetical protein DFP73DRAFT_564312 [Morchella snyderi]